MSGIDQEQQDPPTMLQYFTEAVCNNPRIKKELLLQRFQLAEVLEDIETLTDPAMRLANQQQQQQKEGLEDGGKDSNNSKRSADGPSFSLHAYEGGDDDDEEPCYGVKITWGELVDRMIRYSKAHNFDADESHCIRVFNVLRSCLLRAHSSPTGEQSAFDTNSDAGRLQLKNYREKQVFLDARGVTNAALLAVSTHSAGIQDNLADKALDLLMELLFGGAQRVQMSVYRFICEEDKDAKFLNHLKQRIAQSEDIIKVGW